MVNESSKPKTARSYRATVVGDNTVVSINLKWYEKELDLNPLSRWGKKKNKK